MEQLGHKESGVYMIYNHVNAKCYVGSTTNFNRRKRQHIRELKRNLHSNTYLQRAIAKYGKENFSFIILERYILTDNLLERESFWMEEKNSIANGYNLVTALRTSSSTLACEEFRENKRRSVWHSIHPNKSEEDYVQWKNNRRLKRQGYRTLPIKMFSKSGEFIQDFPSARAVINSIGGNIDNLREVLSPKSRYKTYRGFVLIYQRDYLEGIDYSYKRKTGYKQSNPRPKIKEPYKKKIPLEQRVICQINILTGEIVEFENTTKTCINANIPMKKLEKVLYGYKKSYKGYKYIRKNPITSH